MKNPSILYQSPNNIRSRSSQAVIFTHRTSLMFVISTNTLKTFLCQAEWLLSWFLKWVSDPNFIILFAATTRSVGSCWEAITCRCQQMRTNYQQVTVVVDVYLLFMQNLTVQLPWLKLPTFWRPLAGNLDVNCHHSTTGSYLYTHPQQVNKL